ncbi:MAG TPA: iron ABC transporter permease [Verrucomicrobia bacterium]|nr:iron ABC transporter permease [Verrucomicrobiota bacterium]
MTLEKSIQNRRRWLWLILISAPGVIVLSIFLGVGWNEPGFLFNPAQRGILEVRLWRVFLGVLVGASLSAGGVILQAVLRNPLADPYVLGLSSGAGLSAALCIVGGGLALGALVLPMAGFVGALVSLAAVYRLARVGRTTAPHTLVLAGVVWGSLCGSLLMFIVSQSSAEGLHAIMWWFLGDLQVFDAGMVRIMAVLIAASFAALAFFARDLNVILLGDEMAGHVGLHPERVKIAVLSLAAVLTASAVSVSGLIGFVGLVVPHAMRALVGPDHRRLLPASVAAGAAFLALADGLGRLLFFPIEIPVGIFTSLIGGPFFLFLLRGRRKEMWS